MRSDTVELTTAQAIVRYLTNQFVIEEGETVPLFGGVFAIFGHGNVTCLGEALYNVQDVLPTWRGQNEQSMALAGVAYARAKRRRRIMVAASSIGPGATNMVTAASVAHTNRLPLLILSGDVFANRRPDPALQQVEHFGNPAMTVNDCFKPVTRYWDRITHPGQIISSLPQAIAMMLDPAECGPAFIGLCQDVQEMAFNYPTKFFEPVIHNITRPRPDTQSIKEAAKCLLEAKRPMIISGGGVHYSLAEEALSNLALKHGIPVAETIAGKSTLLHDHPCNLGTIGVVGSTSANQMAAEADTILAIGTRLQDFITGSWSAFDPEAKFISINTTRFDAIKHRALPVIGDASEALNELTPLLEGWEVDSAWIELGQNRYAGWKEIVDKHQTPDKTSLPSYAHVVGAVNRAAEVGDIVVSSAGGIVGELVKGWHAKSEHTFALDMGSSCMGYEIAGSWGTAMAEPERNTFAMLGDGSYLMMNSDIYSSVLAGHKIIAIVCDNGGYAIINRLQTSKGCESFNNLFSDSRVKEAFSTDFAKHAEAMGALSRHVSNIDDFEKALVWAKGADKTVVISITTDPDVWTPGDAWWDVGVPEVSESAEVRKAYAEQLAERQKQRYGV